jgi:predicted RNA binding protein YcfA (HicA-like mRNA interferase family)
VYKYRHREETMKSGDLIKTLTAAGCILRRQGGGCHQIWWSPITGRTFPVPHPKKDLPVGTVKAIRKMAGIQTH